MSIYKSEAGERAVADKYRAILERWPVANRQLRVPTRQGETFVIVSGKDDAPPLLLLHGSASNAASWLADVPTLSQHYRVYAIDMIGEPGFSAPARPALASEAHALWLDDVLEGLSLTRVSMVGISLGGWLALDYATRRPGSVEQLVLLCPGGVGRQKNFLLKALPLLFLGAWGRRRMFEMVFRGVTAPETPLSQTFSELMAAIHAHFRLRTEKLPVFSDEALQPLRMPILCILGGKDVLLNSDDTRARLQKNTPQAEIDYLPEAGHILIGFSARILDFLLKTRRAESKDNVRHAS